MDNWFSVDSAALLGIQRQTVRGVDMKSKYCHKCDEQQEMAEVTDGKNSLFQCLKCETIHSELRCILTEETFV